VVTTRIRDCLQTGKSFQHVTNTKVNSAFHPSSLSELSAGNTLTLITSKIGYSICIWPTLPLGWLLSKMCLLGLLTTSAVKGNVLSADICRLFCTRCFVHSCSVCKHPVWCCTLYNRCPVSYLSLFGTLKLICVIIILGYERYKNYNIFFSFLTVWSFITRGYKNNNSNNNGNNLVWFWQVKKAFLALVQNGVRAAALWDSVKQDFVGKYLTMLLTGQYWHYVLLLVYLLYAI